MKPLLKYAYVLTHDGEAACDLVQDSVVKAMAARSGPDDPAKYRSWLFAILRNCFIDNIRHANREVDVVSLTDDGDMPVNGALLAVEESLVNSLNVRTSMEKLPTSQREILLLIDICGFSYAETAAILSIRPGTVMSRISRARQKLIENVSATNVHTIPQRTLAKKGGAL